MEQRKNKRDGISVEEIILKDNQGGILPKISVIGKKFTNYMKGAIDRVIFGSDSVTGESEQQAITTLTNQLPNDYFSQRRKRRRDEFPNLDQDSKLPSKSTRLDTTPSDSFVPTFRVADDPQFIHENNLMNKQIEAHLSKQILQEEQANMEVEPVENHQSTSLAEISESELQTFFKNRPSSFYGLPSAYVARYRNYKDKAASMESIRKAERNYRTSNPFKYSSVMTDDHHVHRLECAGVGKTVSQKRFEKDLESMRHNTKSFHEDRHHKNHHHGPVCLKCNRRLPNNLITSRVARSKHNIENGEGDESNTIPAIVRDFSMQVGGSFSEAGGKLPNDQNSTAPINQFDNIATTTTTNSTPSADNKADLPNIPHANTTNGYSNLAQTNTTNGINRESLGGAANQGAGHSELIRPIDSSQTQQGASKITEPTFPDVIDDKKSSIFCQDKPPLNSQLSTGVSPDSLSAFKNNNLEVNTFPSTVPPKSTIEKQPFNIGAAPSAPVSVLESNINFLTNSTNSTISQNPLYYNLKETQGAFSSNLNPNVSNLAAPLTTDSASVDIRIEKEDSKSNSTNNNDDDDDRAALNPRNLSSHSNLLGTLPSQCNINHQENNQLVKAASQNSTSASVDDDENKVNSVFNTKPSTATSYLKQSTSSVTINSSFVNPSIGLIQERSEKNTTHGQSEDTTKTALSGPLAVDSTGNTVNKGPFGGPLLDDQCGPNNANKILPNFKIQDITSNQLTPSTVSFAAKSTENDLKSDKKQESAFVMADSLSNSAKDSKIVKQGENTCDSEAGSAKKSFFGSFSLNSSTKPSHPFTTDTQKPIGECEQLSSGKAFGAGFGTTEAKGSSLSSASFGTTDAKGGSFSTAGFGTTGTKSGPFSTAGFGTTGEKSGPFSAGGFSTTEAKSSPFSTSGLGTTEAKSGTFSTAGFGTTEAKRSPFSTAGFGTTEAKSSPFSTAGFGTTEVKSGPFSTAGFGTTEAKSSPFSTAGFGTAEAKSNPFSTSGFGTTESKSSPFSTSGFGTAEAKSGPFSTAVFGDGKSNISAFGGSANTPFGSFPSNTQSSGLGNQQQMGFQSTKNWSNSQNSAPPSKPFVFQPVNPAENLSFTFSNSGTSAPQNPTLSQIPNTGTFSFSNNQPTPSTLPFQSNIAEQNNLEQRRKLRQKQRRI